MTCIVKQLKAKIIKSTYFIKIPKFSFNSPFSMLLLSCTCQMKSLQAIRQIKLPLRAKTLLFSSKILLFPIRMLKMDTICFKIRT